MGNKPVCVAKLAPVTTAPRHEQSVGRDLPMRTRRISSRTILNEAY
jgi:hypothetical protein